MIKNNHSDNLSSSDMKEIDIHIAEYNALTTRCTYFINIQNILLTALIAWIVVIGTIWNSNFEYILTWSFLLGCHIIALINVNFSYEHYNIVRYIERDLKPKIKKLIANEIFWNYESYLVEERKNNNIWIIVFEYLAVILSVLTIITICIFRIPHWVRLDFFGFSLNILLFLLLLTKTRQTVKIRISSWH